MQDKIERKKSAVQKAIEKTHGGARLGAGRKRKDKDTIVVTFRVDAESFLACKLFYGKEFNREVNQLIRNRAIQILKKKHTFKTQPAPKPAAG